MTIDENAPIRLEDIIPIAFPFGGISLAGLRKEVARGNLAVERIAGKLFTTLADIKRMREKCREQKEPISTNDLPGREDVMRFRRSEAESASAAQESLLRLVETERKKLLKKP
jgi:hypothetical protein